MTEVQFQLAGAAGEQPPVVTASGDIDLANVNQFHDLMAQAAGSAEAIIVDLSRVSYCDSATVRALFSVAASTKLTLVVRSTGSIMTLISVAGLDRVATVTTLDE
jgi:anti-anti-sigma factor